MSGSDQHAHPVERGPNRLRTLDEESSFEFDLRRSGKRTHLRSGKRTHPQSGVLRERPRINCARDVAIARAGRGLGLECPPRGAARWINCTSPRATRRERATAHEGQRDADSSRPVRDDASVPRQSGVLREPPKINCARDVAIARAGRGLGLSARRETPQVDRLVVAAGDAARRRQRARAPARSHSSEAAGDDAPPLRTADGAGVIDARGGPASDDLRRGGPRLRAVGRRAERRPVDLDRVATVTKPAQERADHLFASEEAVPVVVVEVRRDERRATGIALLHELEEEVRLLRLADSSSPFRR